MLKRIVFVLFFLFTAANAIAQDLPRTEARVVWLPIDRSYQEKDSLIAFLSGVSNIGLQNRQLLKGYQSSADEIPGIRPKKDFLETGAGFIYAADSIQVAFIRMYNPADTLERGDMISLQMQVPQLPYRGVFSELAFNGIIFTDAEKNPLYTLDYLFHHDSRELEDSLFGVIIKSLHSTYELVKDRPELPASLLAKVTAGRFKNRIPLEIIRDVTRKDLEAFFMYTKAYPVGYMGKNYRASESFAGWLVSNSPYSVGEVKQGLFPFYKNPVEFRKRLPEFKADVLKEHTASTLATDVIGLSDAFKFEEAHQLADFTIALAEGVNDTMAKPMVYICKAQIYLDQEKYMESVAWCDKAIKAALLAGDRDIEIQAIIKKGYCYFKVSKYPQTESVLSNAVEKLNQYRIMLSERDYNNNHRKILEYRSSIRYKAGRYDEALQLLDSAISFNNRINSYDAQISNAGYYGFIGKVYNDQGKPGEALVALQKAVTIYRNNSDLLNSAITVNDIAYSYYKQGNYRQSIEQAGKALNNLLEQQDFNNAGYSMSLTGSCYWQMGLYDSALSAHHASVALREKSGNKSGQAYSWTRLGDLYKESGSKKLSMQAYAKAAELYRSLADSAGMAEVYTARGQVYLDDENYKNAAIEFEKANGISHKSTVEALYKLGISWSSIDTVKARKYHQEARLNSISDGNTEYQFYASGALARLAYSKQDMATGDFYYDECKRLSKQMNTAIADAQCLSLLAYKYEADTQLDSALLYYRKAMAITDTVNRSSSVDHMNNIASIYIAMGDFREAEEILNLAIRVAREISDSLSLGSTLQFSSFLYSRTAEFAKGLANNDSALAIFTRSGHRIRLAGTYATRATLYSSMGDNKESILANLYADSLYNEELQKKQQGILYNNIGIVYMSQGDYPTALKYLQKSLATLPKGVINEDYLLTQGNVAECYIGLKKYKEARSLLMDYLPKARKLKLNRIASGMAQVAGKLSLQEQKFSDAISYYTEAWQFASASGEKEKALEALINLGRIYRKQGKPDTAAVRIREAVALSLKYKLAGSWEAFYESGLFSYEAKQYDTAVVYFKEAVGLLERLTDRLYGGEAAKKIFNNDPRKSDLFNKITFSYYNLGDINQAWSYANRSNIAGIRELSGSLTTNSSDAEKNEALKKLFSLQESKKALEGTLEKQEGVARQETLKKIEILEADYNNFLSDVVELYPDLGTYFSKSNADEFNKYKSKLPSDVAVALYLLNDKTLMIFTLTNEKLAVDTMTVDLAPRISRFIEAIKNTNKQTGTGPLSLRSDPVDEDKTASTADFTDLSGDLYQVLIQSVADKINGKEKLCIIPTGVFSNMPFQCLGRKQEGNSFRFLIEDHTVFFTNKMSVFSDSMQQPVPKNNYSFAAFGVPDATLRFNIDEVKTIGKMFGSDSTVYTDTRATESMAKQSLVTKKFIHFATHGVLNYSTDYSMSYLKLLPDKDSTQGNNGKLTMREIQRLGITDCSMVILSACQTAVSKELVKGWSISPANSFLISNVKTVVASLWKVADEPTSLLMQYFYENLPVMGKAEALRQAQVRLSKDPRFVHPNYWGAFVLYGDWR